jgi:hypothetical protein
MKLDKEKGTISIKGVGVTTLHMPIYFMAEDAPENRKEMYNYLKDKMSKIEHGDLSSLILPSDRDMCGELMFFIDQPEITMTFPSITRIESVGEILVATTQEETKNDSN